MDINILPKTQNLKIDRNSKIRRYVLTATHLPNMGGGGGGVKK